MHLLDLVLIVIIAGWGVAGALTGFTAQLNTIISIILASIGAWLFYPIVAYKIEGLLQSPAVSVVVAPIVLFILIGLISKVMLKLLTKVISSEESSGSGWVLGCAFGVFKGLILGGVVIYFLGQYGKPELIEDSVSFKRYYKVSEHVVSLSEEYGIGAKIEKAGDYLRENMLPPSDQRKESIESAATSFYNDKIAGYFENDFFNSASEFFSSGKEDTDSE